MNISDDNFPIIACSSGNTNSNVGVSLIRISGNFQLEDFKNFFSIDLCKIKSRYTTFSKFIGTNGTVFDEILVTFFKGPNSYTGENCLELSVHGNVLNVERIIKSFLDTKKTKLAHPGEFTKRAYVNKKLSLTQVEGLDLFLNAETPFVLNAGLSLLQGELFNNYKVLDEHFQKLLMSVSIATDFVDDVGEENSDTFLNVSFNSFFSKLKILNDRASASSNSIFNPTIVIVGKTNAGKSKFFNNLLSMNRSIVSNVHGTTRDYVSEGIKFDGINFRLIDTAGIRESSDLIESEGISRSKNLLCESFFKILVINPFDDFDIFQSELNYDLVVFSHLDCVNFEKNAVNILKLLNKPSMPIVAVSLVEDGPIGPLKTFGPIGPLLNSGPIGPDNCFAGGPIGPMFAESFPEFKNFLGSVLVSKYNKFTENNPIIIERHRQIIEDLYNKALLFQDVIACGDLGIISSELNIIKNSISELFGIVTTDDLLASIFDNFCIGK